MEQALAALELAVRDHDWHRVRLAVEAMRASLVETPSEGNRPGPGVAEGYVVLPGYGQMTMPTQDYANASASQRKNIALEGDEV